MGNEDGFVVGVVACDNPHSNFHVKTLEELDEVDGGVPVRVGGGRPG